MIDHESYIDTINQNLSKLLLVDKIFIINEWEAIYDYIWEHVQSHLMGFGVKRENILISDCGVNKFLDYNHIWNPALTVDHLDIQPDKYPFKPVGERTFYFNSLARIPKPFRVLFTAELFRRKLENYGLITCGTAAEGATGNWGNVYELYVHDDIKFRFPYALNRPAVERSNFYSDIVDQFNDCIIHVALETSFENTLYSKNNLPLNTMWDRIFPTEKTILAFSMFQLPLILSVPGTVEFVRSMGFDMFDDIIDHSYDKEQDPERRILMVVDELERLVNENNLKSYDLTTRLYKNAEWVYKAAEFNFKSYAQKIHGWYYR